MPVGKGFGEHWESTPLGYITDTQKIPCATCKLNNGHMTYAHRVCHDWKALWNQVIKRLHKYTQEHAKLPEMEIR